MASHVGFPLTVTHFCVALPMPAVLAPQSAGVQPVTVAWHSSSFRTQTWPEGQNWARQGVCSSTTASCVPQSEPALGTATFAVASTTRDFAQPPVPGSTTRNAMVGLPLTTSIFE